MYTLYTHGLTDVLYSICDDNYKFYWFDLLMCIKQIISHVHVVVMRLHR